MVHCTYSLFSVHLALQLSNLRFLVKHFYFVLGVPPFMCSSGLAKGLGRIYVQILELFFGDSPVPGLSSFISSLFSCFGSPKLHSLTSQARKNVVSCLETVAMCRCDVPDVLCRIGSDYKWKAVQMQMLSSEVPFYRESTCFQYACLLSFSNVLN